MTKENEKIYRQRVTIEKERRRSRSRSRRSRRGSGSRRQHRAAAPGRSRTRSRSRAAKKKAQLLPRQTRDPSTRRSRSRSPLGRVPKFIKTKGKIEKERREFRIEVAELEARRRHALTMLRRK